MKYKLLSLMILIVILINIIVFQASASSNTIARWNTCTLTYQINYKNVTTKEYNNINQSLKQISKHTGIEFIYKGSTKHMPTIENTNSKANITIAFPKKKQSNLYYKHGGRALVNYVNGTITDAAVSIRPVMTKYDNIIGLYTHELIHTIGVHNHTNDTTSIMNSTIYVSTPNKQDILMLNTIGKQMGCK